MGSPGGKTSCLVFVLLTYGLVFLFFSPPGQLYGLEKFWAFLKYSKAKNLDINSKLQEYLSKFKRLEDFRVDVSRHNSCSLLMVPANGPLRVEDFGGPQVVAGGGAVTPTVTPSHCSQAGNKRRDWNMANPLSVG